MKRKRHIGLDGFFLLMTAGISICLVFMNVNYDTEYQLAMAYRRIMGDQPITQMWEPNQTSVFLCAIFLKLYLAVTKTTTGVVLYMQLIGLLIRACIGFGLYRALKGVCETSTRTLVLISYILISPKEMLAPEYSNMQLWFGTLLFLFLFRYLQTKKKYLLVLAAVALCLEVVTYPSCLLVYFAAAIILWKYSEERIKDMALFTGVCAGIGLGVLWHYLGGIEPEVIGKCLHAALAVEPTHTVDFGEKMAAYIGNVVHTVLVLCAFGIGGAAVEICVGVACRKARGERKFKTAEWGLFTSAGLLIYLLSNIIRADYRGGYIYLLTAILVFGFLCRKELKETNETFVYRMALLIGGTGILATMLLSDMPFLQSVPYGLLAICISLLPIMRYAERVRRETVLAGALPYVGYAFLALIMLRCAYIHIPIYGYGQICSLSSDLALIRRGPAVGIITDEEGAARQRDSMEEWDAYIEDGSKIWIIGGGIVDTLGYLYQPTEIAAPSTMSTPTYNEELLYYWELNPEKYPDVVILSSGFGTLNYELVNNQWLMQWLEEDFHATRVEDGNYWRYYFR